MTGLSRFVLCQFPKRQLRSFHVLCSFMVHYKSSLLLYIYQPFVLQWHISESIYVSHYDNTNDWYLYVCMYDEYCMLCRYLWEIKCRLILSCMYISYGLEAWCNPEDLTKTLYRLNKQLFSAGVLLIKQYDHKWCIQIYLKWLRLMKFISV